MDALAELRRSLSRSPSKNSDFRSYSARSHSPSSRNLPFAPSPLSPRRSTSDNFLQTSSAAPSPLAIPFPPSAKIQRPVLRRRVSPRSPGKRVLTDSSNKGNTTPVVFSTRRSFEKEKPYTDVQQANDKENEGVLDVDEVPRQALKRRSGNFSTIAAASSPLKRSDGIMNLEQASQGSPSAKRRSLHGASFGSDFNIFELEGNREEESQFESQASTEGSEFGMGSPASHIPTHMTPIPRRSSSLRKSTLQQRQHERPLLFRSRPAGEQSPHSPLVLTAATHSKARPRMSLDNQLFSPSTRDSPFSAGALPNASIHALGSQTCAQNSRHPLSRTMTQSSSSSSLVEDSPTHEPVHKFDRPRPMLDFSRSLPIGSARPTGLPQQANDSQGTSSQGSFATPASYKFAKPLPAAFMSTGLISKKNRNVDEPLGGLPKAHMPDTPCKRASLHLTDVPDVVAEPRPKDFRQSFGAPATPHIFGKPGQLTYPGGASLFTNHPRQSIVRRTSFASIESDDKVRSSQSPTARPASQSTTDSEFPPTPTKRNLGQSHGSHGPASEAPDSVLSKTAPAIRFSSSKLDSISSSPDSVSGDSDSVMEQSPSVSLRLKSSPNDHSGPSSFSQSRMLKRPSGSTPLAKKANGLPSLSISAADAHAKLKLLSPASPHLPRTRITSPHTPNENIVPPDPSGLSISVHNEQPLFYNTNNNYATPATPTAAREYFPTFGNRASLPLAGVDPTDVDPALTSRFEKVELIGTGEFSQVYRVTQQPEASPYHPVFSLSSTRSSSQASLPERVWAVKKSKTPYAGAKDRQKKLHEVNVLKALGQSDHIITYFDSWEVRNHLYIQTEFCEEGPLDMFLGKIGSSGRLDDFRIWKILLELSLGLKHIHDQGFIHLDIKPANILVTFEGVLKIADFGMTTKWPAKSSIDGEGDREYIGPEILRGQYDKPADVFALGLIMLEIAGNVQLPDNGVSWQKLRNGDLSDVPSLTWTSEASNVTRDVSNHTVDRDPSFEMRDVDSNGDLDIPESPSSRKQLRGNTATYLARSGELTQPPAFMVDVNNEQALDRIVRWMISPNPADRPRPDDILQMTGVQWVDARRRAGATVFEGNWGPADEILAEDAEMLDV